MERKPHPPWELCSICEESLVPDTARVVRRASSRPITFHCRGCRIGRRTQWHMDCVADQLRKLDDDEVGIMCAQCMRTSWFRRQSGWLLTLLRVLWVSYPRTDRWLPGYGVFLMNRVIDAVVMLWGVAFIVFVRTIGPYVDDYHPGIGSKIPREELDFQYAQMRAQILDSGRPNLAAANMIAAWIFGWTCISVLFALASAAWTAVRCKRVQTGRGLIED